MANNDRRWEHRVEVNTMPAERQVPQPEMSRVSWKHPGSPSPFPYSTMPSNASLNLCEDGSSHENSLTNDYKTQSKLGISLGSVERTMPNSDQSSVRYADDSTTFGSSAYVLSSQTEPWARKTALRNTPHELHHDGDSLNSITLNEIPRYMGSWIPKYGDDTQCFGGHHPARMNEPEGHTHSKSLDEKLRNVFDIDAPTRKRSETFSGLSNLERLVLSGKLPWHKKQYIKGDFQYPTKSSPHGKDVMLKSESVISNSDAHVPESSLDVEFGTIEDDLKTLSISHEPTRSGLFRNREIAEDLVHEDISHSLRLNGKSVPINRTVADDDSNSIKSTLSVSNECTTNITDSDVPETPNSNSSPDSDQWTHLCSMALGRARPVLLKEAMNEYQQLYASDCRMITSCNPDSAAPSSQTGSTGFPNQQTGSNSAGRDQARNNGAHGRNPPDDGNDGTPNKRPRKDSTSNGRIIGLTLRYACPFFKRNPQKYGSRSACSGPGWESVHRMKEHLYRSHAQPIHCPRCNLNLASQQDLIEHLSSKDRCEESGGVSNQKGNSIEGFDEEQEKKLRRRSQSGQTENEKWIEVYKILFPKDDHSKIPSPFYEYQLGIPPESLPSPTSDTIARFEDLCQRELPGIMRSKLELIIDEELQRISERIKSRVPEIVRSSQEEFLQRFQRHEPASSNVAEGYFGESEQRHPSDHVGQLSSNFDNGFAAQSHISQFFLQPPPIPHERNIRYLEDGIRGIVQERASWNLGSDSGYNSGVSNDGLGTNSISLIDAPQGLNNLGLPGNIETQISPPRNTTFGATDVASSMNNPSLTQDAEMAPPFNAKSWSDHADSSYFGRPDGAYM